jgi:hypothetical protein
MINPDSKESDYALESQDKVIVYKKSAPKMKNRRPRSNLRADEFSRHVSLTGADFLCLTARL